MLICDMILNGVRRVSWVVFEGVFDCVALKEDRVLILASPLDFFWIVVML